MDARAITITNTATGQVILSAAVVSQHVNVEGYTVFTLDAMSTGPRGGGARSVLYYRGRRSEEWSLIESDGWAVIGSDTGNVVCRREYSIAFN